jgi:hypothetical protein
LRRRAGAGRLGAVEIRAQGAIMSSRNRIARRPLLAAALLISLAANGMARAESIPTEYLDRDQQSCITACNGGKLLSPESCTAYCSCEVQAVGEQFTLDDYKKMTTAVSQQQAPEPAILEKMRTISNTCKAGLK